MSKSQILAREQPWFVRVAIASIAGGLLAIVGFVLLGAAIGGDTNFENLVEAHDNSSNVWISGVLTCLGYLLIGVPLYFLYRAAQARSVRVKSQMVGLVLLGPLLLALSAPLISAGTQEAANSYLDGKVQPDKSASEIKQECEEDKKDKSAADFAEDFPAVDGKTGLGACEAKKTEESVASEAIKGSTLLSVGQFAGLAGTLGFVIGMVYTVLWSMRTGLLTRFWGSLGMAVGVISILGLAPFRILTFLWFVFIGVMLTGVMKGGRPPAWAAGEAVPWPTPGEKAAGEMAPSGSAPIDVDSEEIDPDGSPEPPSGNGNGNGGGGEPPRKRKRRE